MKTEPIQDYILKSKQNLRIAAAVGESWPDAREKLVSAFLDRLEIRLKRNLKGWKFDRWGGRFFVERYPAYCFWKPAWEGQYYLALECTDYGQRMIFGVMREKDRIGKRPFSEQLQNAVRELHPSVGTHSWWEARIRLSSPAADWRKPEELWRMHKDKSFLDDVAEQLLAVAEVSESIIDRLARKK